jgi:beta-lactamase class A
VLTLMVIVSDNTATNLMIDRFGMDAVNARMESLGLKNTHLYKKVFKPAVGPMPADQPKFGLGKTTPREMATLMEWIGRCRAATAPGGRVADVSPMDEQDKAVCDVALKMLKNQFYRETVPRYLESADGRRRAAWRLRARRGRWMRCERCGDCAGKTGPMVLSIFTYDNADHGWTVDNEGEVTIAKLAKAIVTAWSPEGLDGKLLVPGLGDGPGCGAAVRQDVAGGFCRRSRT